MNTCKKEYCSHLIVPHIVYLFLLPLPHLVSQSLQGLLFFFFFLKKSSLFPVRKFNSFRTIGSPPAAGTGGCCSAPRSCPRARWCRSQCRCPDLTHIKNKLINMFEFCTIFPTCGVGLVHDLYCLILPPPQRTILPNWSMQGVWMWLLYLSRHKINLFNEDFF